MDKLVNTVRPCVNSVVTSCPALTLNPLRATMASDRSVPSATDRSIRNGMKLSVNIAAN